MPTNFPYEGIGFNKEWIASKSLEDFLAECEINQHWLQGDPNRIEKLTELHSLVINSTEGEAE